MLYRIIISTFLRNSTNEKRLQPIQNEWKKFCLKLNSSHGLNFTHYQKINWLLDSDRMHQCICSHALNFLKTICPLYMKIIVTAKQSLISQSKVI